MNIVLVHNKKDKPLGLSFFFEDNLGVDFSKEFKFVFKISQDRVMAVK